MPLFEYHCIECGTKFDELVHQVDETVECPSCHSRKTQKELSVFAASVSSGSSHMPACAKPGCGNGGFS